VTTTRERRPHPQEAQILELIHKGWNNAAIAERLYCGKQAVREVRRAHGLPQAARSSWRRPHPKERQINQLLDEGHTDVEIRRRTGADVATIAERRRARRIPPALRPRPKARPHPREAEILAALQAGGKGSSNTAIAARLRVDKVAVARIRRDNGIPNTYERKRAEQPSLEERWQQYVREVDGGHLEWTGPRATNSSGTPILRFLGSWYSAAGIAFRMRTGRDPQGQVRAECNVAHCVAPACVEDEPGRQALRLQLRRLQGLPDPPTGTCDNGHDLAKEGRLGSRLDPYCEGCKRDARRSKKRTAKAT
jgi:DNA-binding NarL/FixJ family response regulator